MSTPAKVKTIIETCTVTRADINAAPSAYLDPVSGICRHPRCGRLAHDHPPGVDATNVMVTELKKMSSLLHRMALRQGHDSPPASPPRPTATTSSQVSELTKEYHVLLQLRFKLEQARSNVKTQQAHIAMIRHQLPPDEMSESAILARQRVEDSHIMPGQESSSSVADRSHSARALAHEEALHSQLQEAESDMIGLTGDLTELEHVYRHRKDKYDAEALKLKDVRLQSDLRAGSASSSSSSSSSDTKTAPAPEVKAAGTSAATAALFAAILPKTDGVALSAAIAAGGDVNALNASGEGALHLIVRETFRAPATMPAVVALLEAKADIELKNSSGRTPVQVALMTGWQDHAALLHKRGAKFDAAMHAITPMTCPDCRRVSDAWKANGYALTPYTFENAAYNA